MDIIDKIGRFLGFFGDYDEKDNDEKEPESTKKTSSAENKGEYTAANVVNFNSVALNKENSTLRPVKLVKNEIKTINPKIFDEDARIIANYLRKKITVIVNFENTDDREATRIADFIFGTIYAIDGKGKKIGEKVFIFAPDNVTLESYEEEKKSKDTFLD